MKLGAMALLGGVSLLALALPASAQSIEATVGGATNYNGLNDFTPGLPAVTPGNVSNNGSNSFVLSVGSIVGAIVDPILADIDRQAYRQQFDTSVDQNFVAAPNRGGAVANSGDFSGGTLQAQSVPAFVTQSRRIEVVDATTSTVRFDAQLVNAEAGGLDGALRHVVRGTVAGNAGLSTITPGPTTEVTNADAVGLSVQALVGGNVFASYTMHSFYFVLADNNVESTAFGIVVDGSTNGSDFLVSDNTILSKAGANAFATDMIVDPGLAGSNVTVANGGVQLADSVDVNAAVNGVTAGVRSSAGSGSQLFGKSDFNVLNNTIEPSVIVNDLQRSVAGDLDNAALDGIVGAGEQVAATFGAGAFVASNSNFNAVGLFLNSDGTDADSLGDSTVAVLGNAVTASTIVNRSTAVIDPTGGLGVPIDEAGAQLVTTTTGNPLSVEANLGHDTSNDFAGARFGVRVEDADVFASNIVVSDNTASADLVVNERTLILGVAAAVQAVLDYEGNNVADLEVLLNAANVTSAVVLDVDTNSITQTVDRNGATTLTLQAHSVGTSATLFDFDTLRGTDVVVSGNDFSASAVLNDLTIAIAPLNGPITRADVSQLGGGQFVDQISATTELRRSYLGLLNGNSVGGSVGEDVNVVVQDNIVVSELVGSRRVIDVMGINGPISGAGLLFGLQAPGSNQSIRRSTFVASIGRALSNEPGAQMGIVGPLAGGIDSTDSAVNLALQGNGIFADLIIGDEEIRFREIAADIDDTFFFSFNSRVVDDVNALALVANSGMGILGATGVIGVGDGTVNVGLTNNDIRARLIGQRLLFAIDELSGNVSSTGLINTNVSGVVDDSFLDSIVRDIVVGIQTSDNVGGPDASVSLQVANLAIESTAIVSERNFELGDLGSSNFAGRFLFPNTPTHDQNPRNEQVRAFVGQQRDANTAAPVRVGLVDADNILGGDVNVTLSGVDIFANAKGAVYDGRIERLGAIGATGEINFDARAVDDILNPTPNNYLARTVNVVVGVDAPANTLEGGTLVLNEIRVGAQASAVESSQNVEQVSGTIAGQLVLGATQLVDGGVAGGSARAELGAVGQGVAVGSVLATTAGSGFDTVISGVSLSAAADGTSVSQIVSGISGAVSGAIALATNQTVTGNFDISATATEASISVNPGPAGTSIVSGSGISASATGNRATGSVGN